MPLMKFSRHGFCAVLALAQIHGYGALAGPAERGVMVLPLSGLDAGEVRQCGVRAISGTGADQLIIDIALERFGAAADFVVRASATKAHSADLSDVWLMPRTVALASMSKPARTPDGLERRAPASDEKVTAFIHELMLRGTRIAVVMAQRDVTIDLPGPLSASVRAAYLNCAGDLYRPGE